MLVETLEINIFSGDTITIDIVLSDNNNNPIDITNAKLYITIKENISYPDTQAIIKKEINCNDFQNSLNMRIVLNSNETKRLQGNKIYFFDVRIKFSNGNAITLGYGKITVKEPITRDI